MPIGVYNRSQSYREKRSQISRDYWSKEENKKAQSTRMKGKEAWNKGLKGFRAKDKNNMWKGGITKHEKGYILIHKPEHPAAQNKQYVPEHRLIMEKSIGRYLRDDEHIHHKNGIKTDNRIENLEILNPNTHAILHNINRQRDKKGRYLS